MAGLVTDMMTNKVQSKEPTPKVTNTAAPSAHCCIQGGGSLRGRHPGLQVGAQGRWGDSDRGGGAGKGNQEGQQQQWRQRRDSGQVGRTDYQFLQR